MRLISRLVLGGAAVAAAVAISSPPASAAEPCGSVHVGSCYVYDPNGSYTCTLAYVSVGHTASVCLIEWQP